MKEILDKLLDWFKQEEGKDPYSVGIYLIGKEEAIEIVVNKELIIEYSDQFIFINSQCYIGLIRIDRISEITEI